MVADVDKLPVMNKLYIYGTLELENRDFVLNASVILIQGGRLIVGFENEPYTKNGLIFLRGNHSTPELVMPNGGPVVGSCALGEFVNRTLTLLRLSRTDMIRGGGGRIEMNKDNN